jgi:hypothetical protein
MSRITERNKANIIVPYVTRVVKFPQVYPISLLIWRMLGLQCSNVLFVGLQYFVYIRRYEPQLPNYQNVQTNWQSLHTCLLVLASRAPDTVTIALTLSPIVVSDEARVL